MTTTATEYPGGDFVSPPSRTRSRSSRAGAPQQPGMPHPDRETTNLPHQTQRTTAAPPDSEAWRREAAGRPSSDIPPPTAAAAATAAATAAAAPGAGDPRHPSNSAVKGRTRTSIPTPLGRYILGKTIGAGSMGKVKLARREDSNVQVACKIIPRGSTEDGFHTRADKERADQSKEIRTAREAAIVTLLDHPNICGLRDVVRTNYHWYMLFEFVNGGQMLDYIISHGKLKEKQARKFSRQIASALDYCHRNSIVHRDLKIENILISKTGDIKIIDFGLSNLYAPRSHLKTFCGSLYFAAPELLQAKAYTGPEVDVWSFGIVLYVLVCGKVPFDDQSMPALHAKIKRGIVDYPNWLSTECKHLMSRMLVTDPKQRATMQEVMAHPWMTKGYGGPPENHLPVRAPIELPLKPEIIKAMTGFNFGKPEDISNRLTRIIESEEYQRAVRSCQERELPLPVKEAEKKRGMLGFDFYKRRNSTNSKDTLTMPSTEALQLGNDPFNAFDPLVSVYYLVAEKQIKDGLESSPKTPGVEHTPKVAAAAAASTPLVAASLGSQARPDQTRTSMTAERVVQQDNNMTNNPNNTNTTNNNNNNNNNVAAGKQPARPRLNEDAFGGGVENLPDPQTLPTSPTSPDPMKREGTAAGILRRLSTRRRKEPERLDSKDRKHPPSVHVLPPEESPRKSFSMRRGRRDQEDDTITEGAGLSRGRSAGSQAPRSELLSPSLTANGAAAAGDTRAKGLNRSSSVNSGDLRRRESRRGAKEPPQTSGSDHGAATNDTTNTATTAQSERRSILPTRALSMRRSLGHARKESIQQRRLRRNEPREDDETASRDATNTPNNNNNNNSDKAPTSADQDDDHGDHSGVSTDRLSDEDLAKPVYLKGLFSVSTTSPKSVPDIRADIKRVLKQLGVEYYLIRGGFSCRHTPSIDLDKVVDPPNSPSQQQQQQQQQVASQQASSQQPPSAGHRRRFSFGGLIGGGGGGGDRDRDEGGDRPPPTPKTPNRGDRSYTNSEESVESLPAVGETNQSRRVPGETSTQIQSDLGGSMVLEFEIFIVKVPLLSLHGIQFKRMVGNTWVFKRMADQILRELRL